MDTTELLQTIRLEGLGIPVIYGVGDRRNDATVIERDGNSWRVYLSDDRGGMYVKTLRAFDNESDALDYALFKLREEVRVNEAMQRLSNRFPTGVFSPGAPEMNG